MLRRSLKSIYLYIEKFFLKFKCKKDILFIAKHRILFNFAWAIHELLKNDERLRLWVCFNNSSLLGPKEVKRLKKAHKMRTISHTVAKYLKWDLVICPDHGSYFRKDCPRIFTGHGLASGKKLQGDHYVFGSRSLDENEDRIIYDKIFVASKFVQSKVKEYYPKFYPVIRVVGSLFVDKVVGIKERNLDLFREMKLDPSRKTVMVISTWGEHALAQKQGTVLIKKIPEITKKYNLIISFHVLNFVKKLSPRYNWKELLSGINSKNVFVLEPGADPFEILSHVDLLVTDITALGLYYPSLGRPIIYFDSPTMEYEDSLSLSRELRSISYVIKNVSSLEIDIAKAFKNFDKAQMKELSSKISSYPGQASRRYVQEIYDSLGLE